MGMASLWRTLDTYWMDLRCTRSVMAVNFADALVLGCSIVTAASSQRSSLQQLAMDPWTAPYLPGCQRSFRWRRRQAGQWEGHSSPPSVHRPIAALVSCKSSWIRWRRKLSRLTRWSFRDILLETNSWCHTWPAFCRRSTRWGPSWLSLLPRTRLLRCSS